MANRRETNTVDEGHIHGSKSTTSPLSSMARSWVTKLLLLLMLTSLARASYELGYRFIEPLSTPTALLASGLFRYREDYSSLISGLHDFARSSNGASIAFELTSKSSKIGRASSFPALVLEDGSHPEGCWNASGRSAQIGVVVSTPVRPMYFAIDYLLTQRDHSRSAPRTVTVWGIVEGAKNRNKLKSLNDSPRNTPPITSPNPIVLLGSFQHQRNARTSPQVFPALSNVQEAQVDFEVFIFHVEDNWGAPYTAVCGTHIYGDTATKVRSFSSTPWW